MARKAAGKAGRTRSTTAHSGRFVANNIATRKKVAGGPITGVASAVTDSVRASRRESQGQRIIDALRGAADAAMTRTTAERFTVRTVETPREPGAFDAAAVRRTRNLLNVSQAVFAHVLGTSLSLVRAWELGTRAPNAMARRLLEEVNAQPDRWRAKLARRTGAGGTNRMAASRVRHTLVDTDGRPRK